MFTPCKVTVFRPESYPGWDNPFLPSGCVSVDADLIVRLWRERRLDQFYAKEGIESENDEGGKVSERRSNGVEDDGTKAVTGDVTKVELPTAKAKNAKLKGSCCSIM